MLSSVSGYIITKTAARMGSRCVCMLISCAELESFALDGLV